MTDKQIFYSEKVNENMFNIKLMGNFKEESQLIGDRQLPSNAIQFKEGDSMQDAFLKGLLVVLPFVILMIALTVFRCKNINYKFEMDFMLAVTLVTVAIGMVVLTYLHEFIHALCYPPNGLKGVWKYVEQGAYFVYCDSIVSKKRFIIINAAPTVILGIVPFILWFVFADSIAMPFSLGIVFTTWMMVIMSVGDFANIFNAIIQVPNNSKIMNYGLHSYWMKKS